MTGDHQTGSRQAIALALPQSARLTVLEEPNVVVVAVDGDSDDWLVRFGKDSSYQPDAWAKNMAAVYNERSDRALALETGE